MLSFITLFKMQITPTNDKIVCEVNPNTIDPIYCLQHNKKNDHKPMHYIKTQLNHVIKEFSN